MHILTTLRAAAERVSSTFGRAATAVAKAIIAIATDIPEVSILSLLARRRRIVSRRGMLRNALLLWRRPIRVGRSMNRKL